MAKHMYQRTGTGGNHYPHYPLLRSVRNLSLGTVAWGRKGIMQPSGIGSPGVEHIYD